MDSDNLAEIPSLGLIDGRLCARSVRYLTFNFNSECFSLLYETDGSNSVSDARGLETRVSCVGEW